jgi:aminopeptidase YwaD
MEFLASDALKGRGSGTPDEFVAATYIASELVQYGLEPAGDQGTYLQRATVVRRKLARAPLLELSLPGTSARKVSWRHGDQMIVLHLGRPHLSGPLQKIDANQPDQKIRPGAVVFVRGEGYNPEDMLSRLLGEGAVGVIFPESASLRARWKEMASRPLELPVQVEGAAEDGVPTFDALALSKSAAAELGQVRDGTLLRLVVSAGPSHNTYTWNAVARIPGSDPSQQHAAVLLTAHLDHLGIGSPVRGDNIYNGADDDASGTTAVLELARVLARQSNRRPVVVALFGSEEKGALGSRYFRDHPPVPLRDIAAYLEFEMIGRPDPKVPADTLWLSGWDRSDLGPHLAAHGAHLVADPHPEEHFFERSDNYVFAKTGMVAQTVSSYGLHKDYHRPSDDLAHIDFKHMDEAIGSFIEPMLWLVNSDFVPQWNKGGKP